MSSSEKTPIPKTGTSTIGSGSNGEPKELAKHIPGAILKIVPGGHNETKNTSLFSEVVISFLGK